jgi:hypothetical protein
VHGDWLRLVSTAWRLAEIVRFNRQLPLMMASVRGGQRAARMTDSGSGPTPIQVRKTFSIGYTDLQR